MNEKQTKKFKKISSRGHRPREDIFPLAICYPNKISHKKYLPEGFSPEGRYFFIIIARFHPKISPRRL